MSRLTIRIDLDRGSIGPGKVGLLEQIESTGSIRKAAAAMKMSYRRAWLLLQALEKTFGQPLIETSTGGRRGGGARLSKAGKTVVRAYRRVEAASTRASGAEIGALGRLTASRKAAMRSDK